MSEKNIITKVELAEQLARVARLQKKDADDVIEKLFAIIAQGLLDPNFGTVKIAGFGTFSVTTRSAHPGVNPTNVNEKIQIPESKNVKFKPSKTLKDLVK